MSELSWTNKAEVIVRLAVRKFGKPEGELVRYAVVESIDELRRSGQRAPVRALIAPLW